MTDFTNIEKIEKLVSRGNNGNASRPQLFRELNELNETTELIISKGKFKRRQTAVFPEKTPNCDLRARSSLSDCSGITRKMSDNAACNAVAVKYRAKFLRSNETLKRDGLLEVICTVRIPE